MTDRICTVCKKSIPWTIVAYNIDGLKCPPCYESE